MKKINRKYLIKEKGLTLVEVLASIVILSIVLIFFLTIFIQTSKTNIKSEDIVDATYLAQTEMEKFYGYSKTVDKSHRVPTLRDSKGYIHESQGNKEIYKTNNSGYDIVITVRDEEELTNILVRVYDSTDHTKPVAQMQNLVRWRTNDEK